jgi:hypothetical protein
MEPFEMEPIFAEFVLKAKDKCFVFLIFTQP